MKKAKRLLAVAISLLALSSCATAQFRPLASGETRLTSMQMPEFVRQDIPYDVILGIDSDTPPKILKVCFRWVAEEISTGSPSLYCYAANIDMTMQPSCANWASGGNVLGSGTFCAGPEQVRSDVPGRLVVRIRPSNLKPNYTRLVGRLEYESDGRVKVTNAVGTRVRVE